MERKGFPFRGWILLMEWLERWGYLTAGLSFLILGMITFVYGWITFFSSLTTGILHASLMLTNDLLFVVILLELFRTVLNFLKSHVVTLEPFLYVGIIAGIRRVLTSGAQLANLENVEKMPDQIFNRYLMDIGANVMIIIVLVLAFYLYRRSVQPAGTLGLPSVPMSSD